MMKKAFGVLILLAIICYTYYCCFEKLPSRDELIQCVTSPNKELHLYVYRYTGDGATVGNAIIVDVVDITKNTRRNIYYRYHDTDATVKWLDNETVVINCIKINVFKERFNSKTESSYLSTSPVKVLYSNDGRYIMNLYHVYEYASYTSVKSFVDVTNTLNWTTHNVCSYNGQLWNVEWSDCNELIINGNKVHLALE